MSIMTFRTSNVKKPNRGLGNSSRGLYNKTMKSCSTAALHAHVHGRVQGVGFRYQALREAERLGLSGWVKNSAYGEVEVWMEGHPDMLAEFSAWLYRGPRTARVDSVTKEEAAPRGYTGLHVEY